MNIQLHSEKDFQFMRRAGQVASATLEFIAPYVKVGVTTNTLNDMCHTFIMNSGAIPAPLNYRGYPKSICTSKNSVVCHGVPDDIPLKNGDILNIDVTVILDGWYGDTSRMFYVGDVSIKAKRLCEVAYNALISSIKMVKPGNKLSIIGYTIEKYVNNFKYSIVRDYCGHGIGKRFHAPPKVLHFYDANDNRLLQEGMFFTIEPMINIGRPDTLLSHLDGWTVTTRDFSLSAQFEHTIGVTKSGVEIFTLSKNESLY